MTQGGDAALCARLIGADPTGLSLRLTLARGMRADGFLEALRAQLDPGVPMLRCPVSVDEGGLLGGRDLEAAMRGETRWRPGLIARAAGGILVIRTAERLPGWAVAAIAAAMDAGELGVLAIEAPEAETPPILLERLALEACLEDALPVETRAPHMSVDLPDVMIDALCGAAERLHVGSDRALILAARAARAHAACRGGAVVRQDDLAVATRLVLAPRRVERRQPEEQAAPPPPREDAAQRAPGERQDAASPGVEDRPAEEAPGAGQEDETRVVQPVDVMLPRLLAEAAGAPRRAAPASGGGRGRQGARIGHAGRPGGPARRMRDGKIDFFATLTSALRHGGEGVRIHPSDLRKRRRVIRPRATVVFVVDASGSAARARLGEAKGAVERVLSECYVRRDRVALIAFRGVGASILLPPTGSLARARRLLAGLASGGPTPLAAGLDAARALISSLHRRGESASLILLTDGRGNIARDGAASRPRAAADAAEAARGLRADGVVTVLVDLAPRAGEASRALAQELGARLLSLSSGAAEAMSQIGITALRAGREAA